MTKFIERHPLWAFAILVAGAAALWLIFATWPQGLEDTFGRKKVFLSAVFNGITLGGLYFLVASGFTLIFGLMRNVNLAHGSLYLFGGYIGYAVSGVTGSWLLSFVAAFIVVALIGVAMQILVFRRIEGQDLRQTMVTIGLSIVFADLMLWAFGGDFYQIQTPHGWSARSNCRSSPPSSLRARRSTCSTPRCGWSSSLRPSYRCRHVARPQSHARRYDRSRRRR